MLKTKMIGEFLLTLIPVLVSVAFLTLAERKILSYSQFRKGPNKVSIGGFLQPFADALKLFFKEIFNPICSNLFVFWVAAMLSIFLSVIIWSFIPWNWSFLNYKYSWIIFLTFLSLNVYPVILGGWSSNSKYAMLGYIRTVAQTISYEVLITLIILSLLILSNSLSLESLIKFNSYNNFFLFFPLFISLWIFCGLAETNRTPFDFAEGESELVSGFNVEFMSGLFTLFFLAEYMNILFMSFLTPILMLKSISSTIFVLLFLLFLIIWIWSRATFPRHRYDLLMYLCWKSLMPFMMMAIMVILVILI